MTIEEIIKAQIKFQEEQADLHYEMAIDEEDDWFGTIATASTHAANVLRQVLKEAEIQGLI